MISDHLPGLILIVFCLVFSAFFSATETAFSSLNRTRLRVMAEKGNRRAALACELAENYDKLLSTILIGNNVVNIAVSSVATLILVALLGSAGATVSTVAVTVVVLIFGEITPKVLAKDQPERFAIFAAPLLRALMWAFTPLNWVFSQWKRLLGRIVRSGGDSHMTQEELLMLLEEVEEEGGLDEDEGELLRNAVEFGDLEAGDILTPRVALEAVSSSATLEEVAALFTASRFSRLPVYQGSIDSIVGVVHQKDIYQGSGLTEKPLTDILSEPVFVPESERADELLKRLQRSKAHMAVVLDEYGGTLGIVTMEDLLEELVGDIWDEHDEVEESFRAMSETAWLVDGAASLSEFCERFDIETWSDRVSVGGWVMEELQHVPAMGESFSRGGFRITVAGLEGRRVSRITVEKNEE